MIYLVECTWCKRLLEFSYAHGSFKQSRWYCMKCCTEKRNMALVRCTCANTHQDELHGKGLRVANKTKTPVRYRCTVCQKEHDHAVKV